MKGILMSGSEFLSCLLLVLHLEKFELYRSIEIFLLFFAVEDLYVAELFISDTQYPNITFLRKKRLHAFDVYLSIFHTCAMSNVDGELEHREPISHNIFTEAGGCFSLLGRLSGKVI
jgi:hypothetical protein